MSSTYTNMQVLDQLNVTLQNFTVLPPDRIRRCEIQTPSINFLPTKSPTESVCRHAFHRWSHLPSLTLSVEKIYIADGFTDGKWAPKKNSRWKYTDGCIPSVIMAYPVNSFQLLVKYRRTLFVGDCGISSKYFSSLSKMPTDFIRLWKRR
jgi:hypothetical protein